MEKPKQTIENQRMLRTIEAEVKTVSKESRQVELSFSSEQPYTRWFGTEILCHDDGCINLARLTEVGALLFHHGRDTNYGFLPVGRIIEVSLDTANKRCRAKVEFDTDEKSELIFQKVLGGSIKGVSVGYFIEAYEEVMPSKTSSNGRFTGPCTVAVKWTPIEISIEPTPADDSVGIGRSIEENDTGDDKMNGQENKPECRENEQNPTPPAPPAPPTPPAGNDREAGIQLERTRITEISAMCRDFNIDPKKFIEDGVSVDNARSAVLAQVKAKGIPATNADVTKDEADKFRTAARDGLMVRMGFRVDKPAEGFRDFIGLSLRELAKECLARDGVENAYRLSDINDLMRSAFVPNSSFVSVVNDAMGAVLSSAYATAPTTFQQWAGKGSNPNFKASKRFRLSAAGDFYEIPQNGEFKNSEIADEGVDTKLKTWGKKFAFGRQTMIDDDLGTIAKAVQAQVRSNKRFINAKVYDALTATGAIYDGKALFHADHKNLGTAGVLAMDSLNELMVKMATQRDMSGAEVLNITPAFLIIPVALQLAAGKIIFSSADPTANNSGVANPFQNKLQIISDAALDAKSTKAFYLAASPADVDTIEVTYLNGKEEPTLENHISFDVLGIEYRIYHDFSVNTLDFRGLAKNNGQ